jgi:phage tail tape-measure protein
MWYEMAMKAQAERDKARLEGGEEASKKVQASQLGASIGGSVGALKGAAIGSIIPGVGTIVGMFVGGLIGTIVGSQNETPLDNAKTIISGGSDILKDLK